MPIEWTEVNEARLGELYGIPRSQRTEDVNVELADLVARMATFDGEQKKVKAEAQRLEVAAKQTERQQIVEEVAPWVKLCKKTGCPAFTVTAESIATAHAVVELVKIMPNVLDRVLSAKGVALQFKPADETSETARALVTVAGTKAVKKGGGNGANRGGKLIALFEQYATPDEKAALETAVATHKAAGGQRSDSIEYKHRVQVKKRLLDAGIIAAE